MEAGHILALNVALAAAWASPGPAMLVAIRASLSKGRRAGYAAGGGLALVAAGWTFAALAGLDAVFHMFPWAYLALKTGGACYLLWLAWATWRTAGAPLEDASRDDRGAFLTGVLVNLGNPKSVLFAAAVLVVIFPPGLGWGAKVAVVANHLAFELLAYGVLVTMLTLQPVAARFMRAKPLLDRLAAGVLAALGVRLFIER